MSHDDFLARRTAREQAADLGLPWPSRNPVRDLLDDAAATGGSIRVNAWPGSNGLASTRAWMVVDVVDCDGNRCWNDGNCIAVVDLRGDFEAFGQHVPADIVVQA